MPKNRLLRKGLAAAVIFLFIGVALAPCINISVVKAADDDFIEVTTEACGIKGFGKNTVKLTRQQYAEVEEIFNEMKIRLTNTTTREEANSICNDSIIKLNEYGLLPQGMSLNQAQKLVTYGHHDARLAKELEQININTEGFFRDNNYLCLLVGKASGASHLGFPFRIPILLNRLTFGLLGNILLLFAIIFTFGYFTPLSFFPYTPFTFFSYMIFGRYTIVDEISHGWLISCGLLGIKNYGESFRGSLFDFVDPAFGPARNTYLHVGATGFTGLCLYDFNTDNTYILGQAIHVKMSY